MKACALAPLHQTILQYFALLSFIGAQPLVGTSYQFYNTYEKPIAAGFSSNASPGEKAV